MVNTESSKSLKLLDLLIAALLFCILFAISYPYYRYYVDPDAVAYLTMAKRAAGGSPWRLVNALWSPLHPAFVAVCIKAGMDALLSAQLTNAVACLLVLAGSFSLFRRFGMDRTAGLPLLLALSIFLVYALYKQLFCDLWQVGLLILYLLIITRKRFLEKPLWWLLCAFVMALATYAKVYSFYFLLLHLPVAIWLLSRRMERVRFPWKQYAIIFCVQWLLLAPLVFLMHHKYGFWGLSKSGALNTSWTLEGHKTLRPEIHALIPPPYFNSPYTWEDPYVSEGTLHTRFESLAMMKSQVGHSVQSALQGIDAADTISCFLLIVILSSCCFLVVKKDQSLFSTGHKLLLAATLIMPLGYLLLHFEARYLWLLVPVSMILGGVWLGAFRNWARNALAYRTICILFAASFIIFPLYDMKQLFRKGEDIYKLAAILGAYNIRGSFTSNDNPNRSGCLAYWLGCNYYTPVSEVVDRAAILSDMQRYRVMFYFHHQNGLDITNDILMDESNQPAQRVDGGHIRGLQVYVVAP